MSIPVKSEAVFQELVARIPGYTPNWVPAPHSAGAALLRIVARYAEILGDGLDRLPERAQLAFLDRVGVGLLPAQPARAPLVFSLLPDSPLAVQLPPGTQIAAPTAPPPPPAPGAPAAPGAESIVFGTDESIMLTGARLASLLTIDPGSDEWADHSGAQRTGFVLFGDLEPVEHALYLGHDENLALSGMAEITLSIDVANHAGAGDPRDLSFVWDYLSKDGWLPLEVIEDSTRRLSRSGLLHLRKTCGPDSREETIAGHTSFWLRGRTSRVPVAVTVLQITKDGVRVDAPGHLRAGDRVTVDGVDTVTVDAITGTAVALSRAPAGLAERVLLRQADPPAALVPTGTGGAVVLPRLESIRGRVSFTRANVEPEGAATDGLPVDPNSTFFPFGARPAPFATIFLASKDVFGRRGAQIGVHVTLRQKGRANKIVLAFEYFDGTRWQSLGGAQELRDATAGFTADGVIVFRCPLDWAPVAVNGQRNHWLRIRLQSGDYGLPERLTVDPANPQKAVFTAGTLQPPIVAQVRLSYRFQTAPTALDHCLAINDFHVVDHTDDARWPRRPFEPFHPVADEQPAVHLGFDRQPPTGLLSLYLATGSDETSLAVTSDYVWEYASPRGWSGLTVRDETLGFRRSGMIQFVGPRDAVAVDGHNGSLYRVRARLKRAARPEPAAQRGIWSNAVWARQRLSFEREVLGSSDGGVRQGYFFPRQRLPVLEGERIEVREWAGRGETWRTVVQGVDAADLSYDHDGATGAVRAVWVRYAARPHLYGSGPGERHHTLERAAGLLRFGDGRHGRIPPAGSPVRATYSSGGGVAGNVAAGAVTELRAAVPYVIGVTNVAPAAGGAETESSGRARLRGAASLRHRDRAISGSDVEWLARQASPAVAQARCLVLTGPDGPRQRGHVSVLIVPDGPDRQPRPTPELLRQVQDHLAARVPAPVAGRVRVLGPSYAVVRVTAEVVPLVAGAAAEVEHLLVQRLDRFLHPVCGRDGQGWQFGQPVYQSEVAAVIETTPGVDYARAVSMQVDDALVDEIAPVPADAMVASGDHEITLVLGGDR